MLAWYDEDPEILYRAVRSLDAVADRVVAADGRWNYYPGDRIQSPADQYIAIHQAAGDAGIESYISQTVSTWKGQVDKRNHLLRLAQPCAFRHRAMTWAAARSAWAPRRRSSGRGKSTIRPGPLRGPLRARCRRAR